MMALLTQDQSDTLQEIVNIGMRQAGDSLARILDVFVELSVPRIRLVTVSDVIDSISDMINSNAEVSVAHQAFSGHGKLRGEAIVIFGQGRMH